MIEYNHKGEWCIYSDITCQEGICSRCNIAMENRKYEINEKILDNILYR